jgi:N-dimethylarginine dimethylaminohydrolase
MNAPVNYEPATQGALRCRKPGGGTEEMTDWYLKSETGPLRDVLLGPLRRGRVYDADLARRQHAEMVQAYESAGTKCHFLPVDEGTPMQVYARDSSFMTPYGAVICQLANPRRRGEYAPALRFYLENNVPVYDMVSMGNFEGGDFNIIKPGVALVGYTDHRSEGVAAKQLAQWFIDEGWEIKFAPIDPFYVHIDLMVCMLTEHCAAVCLETTDPDIVDWLRNMNIEIIPATFEETMALGCNVVALGNDKVLSTLAATDLNQKMRAIGLEVYDPDMTMFTWAGGGVHCMCQPLRRDPA